MSSYFPWFSRPIVTFFGSEWGIPATATRWHSYVVYPFGTTALDFTND